MYKSIIPEIIDAAELGDLSKVRSLVEEGVSLKTYFSDYKISPLQGAALYGHFDIVEYIINNCEELDMEDINASTGNAVHRCTLEIVKLLVEKKGADVSKALIKVMPFYKYPDGVLPSHSVKEELKLRAMQIQIVKFLMTKGPSKKAVHTLLDRVASKGDIELAKCLV